ncbi:hypothetical protein KC19_3G044300 [Ceratodon purpureus]|uniref:Uncharacterized protein n=1 Tax=Ceratodon purpureus TaxID=3225 RepID=A0A8T0IH63_CERPU|nr:hypothetical protein KC19_3G044300 [Ceratodon purpureus]
MVPRDPSVARRCGLHARCQTVYAQQFSFNTSRLWQLREAVRLIRLQCAIRLRPFCDQDEGEVYCRGLSSAAGV